AIRGTVRITSLKGVVLVVIGVERDCQDGRPRRSHARVVSWVVGRDLHVLRRRGAGEEHRDQESEDELSYCEPHAPLLSKDGSTARQKHGRKFLQGLRSCPPAGWLAADGRMVLVLVRGWGGVSLVPVGGARCSVPSCR